MSDRNTSSPMSNSFAMDAVLASPNRLKPLVILYPTSATSPRGSFISDLSMASEASIRATPFSSHHRTVCSSIAMTSTFRIPTREACSSQLTRKSSISIVAKHALTVSPTTNLPSLANAEGVLGLVALMTTGFGSGMTRSGSSSSSSSSSSSVTYCSFRIRASSESPSPLVRLPSNPFHDEVLEADPASMPAPLGGLSSAIHLASSSFGSGRVGADLLSRCDSTPTASAATLHANQCSGWSSDKSLALSTACSRTRGKTSRRRTLTRLRRRRAMMAPATSPVPRFHKSDIVLAEQLHSAAALLSASFRF